MRLWTIQPPEVYDILLKDGEFICDPEKCPELIFEKEEKLSSKMFTNAYNWMAEQMKKRIGDPSVRATYPIWATYMYEWKNKNIDLRTWFDDNHEYLYELELDIPVSEILLSDFSGWHSVLNNGYYGNIKSDEEFDKIYDWLDTLSPTNRQKVITKSWEEIFNITPFENDFTRIGYDVQATFWVLKKEYVKKVRKFKPRKTSKKVLEQNKKIGGKLT